MSMKEKKRKVYAIGRHDGSLCHQKQADSSNHVSDQAWPVLMYLGSFCRLQAGSCLLHSCITQGATAAA